MSLYHVLMSKKANLFMTPASSILNICMTRSVLYLNAVQNLVNPHSFVPLIFMQALNRVQIVHN